MDASSLIRSNPRWIILFKRKYELGGYCLGKNADEVYRLIISRSRNDFFEQSSRRDTNGFLIFDLFHEFVFATLKHCLLSNKKRKIEGFSISNITESWWMHKLDKLNMINPARILPFFILFFPSFIIFFFYYYLANFSCSIILFFNDEIS